MASVISILKNKIAAAIVIFDEKYRDVNPAIEKENDVFIRFSRKDYVDE